MTRILFFIVTITIVLSCVNNIYPEYTLIKKYPQDIPELCLKFVNDSIGMIYKQEDQSTKQYFKFTKIKKSLVVITFASDTNNVILLKKNDTLVYFKNDLYMFNEKHLLFFKKKE